MTDIPRSPIPGRRSVLEIINSDVYKGRSLNGALARLYAFLVPACLVVCATNGFDGSLLNGLQAGKFVLSHRNEQSFSNISA
jgi:hypothetical protein